MLMTHIFTFSKTCPEMSLSLVQLQCLQDVFDWMIASNLKLNPDKTKFILVGIKRQRQKKNKKQYQMSADHATLHIMRFTSLAQMTDSGSNYDTCNVSCVEQARLKKNINHHPKSPESRYARSTNWNYKLTMIINLILICSASELGTQRI